MAAALVVPVILNGFMEAAPPARGALMGGLNVSSNQAGNLIGVALLGSVLAAGLAPHFDDALRAAGSPVEATTARVDRLASHGPDAAVEDIGDPAVRADAAQAGRDAYVEATAHAIRVGAVFSAGSVLLLIALGGRVGPRRAGGSGAPGRSLAISLTPDGERA